MNYNLLRNYIRYIIAESPEGQAAFAKLQKQFSDYESDWKQRNPKDDLSHAKYDMEKEYKNLRRKAKQSWRTYADHAYWDNPNNITLIHSLSWVRKPTSILNAVTNYFDNLYSIKKINNHELSCHALAVPTKKENYNDYIEHIRKQKRVYGMDPYSCDCLVIGRRKVTYASGEDAFTEDLKSATPVQRKQFKSSGLPKRPSKVSHPLFDEDDVKNAIANPRWYMDPKTWDNLSDMFPDMNPNYKMHGIEEVIVDNWLPAFLVLEFTTPEEEVKMLREKFPDLDIFVEDRPDQFNWMA